MAEYIERDEVIAIIEGKQRELCPIGRFSRNMVYGTDRDRFDAWGEIIDQITHIPAADVAPVVHGRWIKGVPVGFSGKPDGYRCSVCKTVVFGIPPRYYQRCGSKMDKDDADGD